MLNDCPDAYLAQQVFSVCWPAGRLGLESTDEWAGRKRTVSGALMSCKLKFFSETTQSRGEDKPRRTATFKRQIKKGGLKRWKRLQERGRWKQPVEKGQTLVSYETAVVIRVGSLIGSGD